jgi:hypothetical protein
MAKSKIEDIINATRIVNALDKRGRLAILRDLQAQGLEAKAMGKIIEKGADQKLVELLELTGAKVVTYKEGVE